MSTKFKKFDGKISFSLWQLQMRGILEKHGLFEALGGVLKKPESMSMTDWEELDLRALTVIQLCLSKEVLREVGKEETSAAVWLKLESLYMTRSLTNKLRLKQQLLLLRMAEGTSIKSHLDAFDTIIMDLENLDVKVDDEDKAIVLLCSLPPSYRHFRETVTYGKESISLEEVKADLLSRDMLNSELTASTSDSQFEDVVARGRPGDRNIENGRFKSRSKSRSKGHMNNVTCHYCKKKGHMKKDCCKLKNKQNFEAKKNDPSKADDGEHESDVDDNDKEDEDDEDCVILDGDPNKVSFEVVDLGDKFDGLVILDAKGQVACRDYPHSRDQCAKFPFDSTPHECHCDLCHCYACDSPAPCACWGCGTLDSDHCHATHNEASWKLVRLRVSMLKATPAPVNKSTEASSSTSQSRHNLVSTTQSTESNSSFHSFAQSVRNAKASSSTSQSQWNLASTTQSTDYAQPIRNARGSSSASHSRHNLAPTFQSAVSNSSLHSSAQSVRNAVRSRPSSRADELDSGYRSRRL